MKRSAKRLIALLGLLLLEGPVAARADPKAPRRAALHFTGPAGTEACIAENALAAAVTERLKRPVFVPEAEADVIVEVRVERAKAPRGFHALIKLTTTSGGVLGTREIQSKEAVCRSLDESLVLVVALLIDPDVALGLASSEPPEVTPALEIAPVSFRQPAPLAASKFLETRPPPPAPPPAPPSPPWRFHAEMGLLLAIGTLPGVGAGPMLRATVTPPHFWGIQVDGSYWPESERRVASVGGFFSVAYAGLALCPLELGPRVLRGDLCAGMKVGAMRAQGFGFDQGNARSSLLVNPTLEGRARFRPSDGPLALSLGLGVGVPLIRSRFFYQLPDGSTKELFRLSPATGSLDIGIGIDLP